MRPIFEIERLKFWVSVGCDMSLGHLFVKQNKHGPTTLLNGQTLIKFEYWEILEYQEIALQKTIYYIQNSKTRPFSRYYLTTNSGCVYLHKAHALQKALEFLQLESFLRKCLQKILMVDSYSLFRNVPKFENPRLQFNKSL